MLRAIIISPDRELNLQLEKVLGETGAAVVRLVDRYADAIELSRMLRAVAPQVVFISTQSIEYCTGAAAHIESIMPGMQVVAVGRNGDAETLMTIMRYGIREFLGMPFDRTVVRACLERIAEVLRLKPMAASMTENVYSFLPSKPGSGATTLAVSAAMSFEAEDAPALLADFDLNCGMVRFMLKLDSEFCLTDALQHAGAMDENLWPQLVTKRGHVDVLHAGRINPEIRIEALNVQRLLEYTRRFYKVICLDLSGNLEKYSLEIMHESKKIFLVCTPEVASLHLAREKMLYLQSLDLSSKVRVLLNRQVRRCPISSTDVEQLVGAPVEMTFANDYAGVSKAISEGHAVQGSDLAKQCVAFARSLTCRQAEPPQERRRFVQYFNLTPARFSFEGRR